MKASEILRQLADMIDSKEQATIAAPTCVVNASELDDTEDKTDTAVMVPPLQQKLEILKKVAGIDSAYDDECSDECDTGAGELDIIKRNAGIPVAIQVASEETDIE